MNAKICTLFLAPPGHSAVLRLPGIHFWYIKAPLCPVWGHGPLCKVLSDPAAGGQPSGGGTQLQWRRQQRLAGGACGPGVATYRSLCLRSPRLVWLPGMKDYTDLLNAWVKTAASVFHNNFSFFICWVGQRLEKTCCLSPNLDRSQGPSDHFQKELLQKDWRVLPYMWFMYRETPSKDVKLKFLNIFFLYQTCIEYG